MLVGISLGIFGSGGSILTVPIMVYLFGLNPISATGYSLFVVGLTSGIGCTSYFIKKLVDLKIALLFSIPSIICVILTRQFILPVIPNPIYFSSTMMISKELLIMIIFAILIIIVAYNMLRSVNYKEPEEKEIPNTNWLWLVLVGFISGFITGILGVGGGFIIIPALVLFAKVPIKMSVGTSLLIIAFNSFSGFVEEIIMYHEILDYRFLFLFSLFSAIGIFIGFRLTIKIYPAQLKRMFGWFVLVVGVLLFIKEVFLTSL